MNNAILNIEFQEFINNNLSSSISELAFKGSPFESVSTRELIEQIEVKKKCQKKLPTWFNANTIYYPNKLNIEQTSSETTAQYKSNLISGNSIIDITGGFGVDAYYFSKQFKQVIHCEIDEHLSKIVAHNFNQFQVKTIKTVNSDGVNYLTQSKQKFDWIYVDPSRRHDSKGKVFYLNDCLPNVPSHLETLFQYSENILVKTSPMLDISIGISELKYVKYIHIVAVKNEVKELLFHLEKDYSQDIEIKTINIQTKVSQHFDFKLNEATTAKANYGPIGCYLYEPNVSLLKSGAFNLISQRLNIDKLQQHTHLYTSHQFKEFPGRRFKVLEVIPYNKKVIYKTIGGKRINLSTRNFPESVSQLKQKFKFKDGGDLYVFFTTIMSDKKVALVCEKII